MRRFISAVLLCVVLSAVHNVPAYADEYTLGPEDYLPPEVPEPSQVDVANSWLSSVPDDEMEFDQYQQIMEILYPELAETEEDGEDDDEDDDGDDDLEESDRLEDDADASGSDARRASGSDARRDKHDKAQTVANIMSIQSAPVVYSNYTPYESSISTTVIAYMSDVLPKLGDVHYVLFRQGRYDYRLVYADEMIYENGVFTAQDASYVAYDSEYSTWHQGPEGGFRLNAGSYIVYSDLGGYPMLASESVPVMLLAFCGAVFLVFTIVRSWLSPQRMVI